MKLSKKVKAKIKNRIFKTFISIALVITTLATMKLTGLSMPLSNKTIAEATITRLPNTDTVTYIYDAADLVAFRDAVNAGDDYSGKTVYLMDDIDLSSVCSSTLGSWTPIGATGASFAGTFDGNYHTISNLYLNSNQFVYLGFFAYCNNSTIRNLILSNVNAYSTYYRSGAGSSTVAGLAGGNSGIIINCGVTGKIDGRQTQSVSGDRTVEVGGIVGTNSGTIQNCYNKATITGATNTSNSVNNVRAGGISGSCYNAGKIYNCYSTGNVTVTGSRFYVGGIVGCFHGASNVMKNSYATGTITINGSSNSTKKAGGIVGVNGDNSSYRGTITNSYCLTTSYSISYYYNGSSTTTSGRIAAAILQTYTVTLGNAFAYDVYNKNNGYPVLAWQNETTVMSLNKNQAYIGIGEKLTLNIVEDDDVTRIIENNYSAKNFTWKSVNEDVATVDENGIVTGVSDGYTTVYAKHETSGLYAMCIVNVAKEIANPQIETGNGFTAILKTDGKVWTIGNNTNGGLGNGTLVNSKIPVQVHIDEDTILDNIVKISVGTDHVLALTKEGKVYGWGSNTNGQLGQNNTNSSTYAKPVLSEDGTSYLSNIVDISANGYGSTALDKNGNVYVWGRGTTGEIGNYTTISSNLPVKTTIKNAIQVSIGDGTVGALTSEGVVWSWGQNTAGQLGINCTNNTTYPMKTALNVTELSVGGYHTTVKRIDGTLYACRSIFLWKNGDRKYSKCYKIYKSKFTKYSYRYQ